jgi:hypothetical protein
VTRKAKPKPSGLTDRVAQVLALFRHLSPAEREEFVRAVTEQRLVAPKAETEAEAAPIRHR